MLPLHQRPLQVMSLGVGPGRSEQSGWRLAVICLLGPAGEFGSCVFPRVGTCFTRETGKGRLEMSTAQADICESISGRSLGFVVIGLGFWHRGPS